jgi:hypothetical protein
MPIKVNVSDQEDKSGGDYVPLPSGNYHCVITDVEPKTSQSQDNFGKDMLYFRFTNQDGIYADRVQGTNACLWSPALYTIIGILKAIGEYENCKENGELTIPTEPEFYLGRSIGVRRGLNKKAKEKNPEDEPSTWIEVKGFSSWSPDREAAGSSNAGVGGRATANSLLP